MRTGLIRTELLAMRDEEYKIFHSRLMPTVPPDKIIGIRVPILRKYANTVAKDPQIEEFLSDLPHKYYEEDNLHAFLIEKIDDFETAIEVLDAFLPYVDNWATCDIMNPRVLEKNREALIRIIDRWLSSGHTYTVRFAVGMLMRHYLGEHFKKEYADRVAGVRSDEYYVKMMVAWYFATALVHNYDSVLPYIENGILEEWVHNKTIQKATESYRIKPEQKRKLRTLKR